MTALSRHIPDGARFRLGEHYGSGASTWLDNAEALITATAVRYGITICGFHDAGWTSVVAVGHSSSGTGVALKATPDHERYCQEKAALMHWNGSGACHLLHSSDRSQILVTELVGGAAGGSMRPPDHTERVAACLTVLHQTNVDRHAAVPGLRGYYRKTVLPRIARRARRFGAAVGGRSIRSALDAGTRLPAIPQRQVMLHADLYAENILFTADRRPVVVDPLPKIGSPAFDWAFWCVYYRQDGGFAGRLAICRSIVPELAAEVRAWSLTLAVDGALYFLDVQDCRADAMLTLIHSPDLVRAGC